VECAACGARVNASCVLRKMGEFMDDNGLGLRSAAVYERIIVTLLEGVRL
jgi:hypothetical protein